MSSLTSVQTVSFGCSQDVLSQFGFGPVPVFPLNPFRMCGRGLIEHSNGADHDIVYARAHSNDTAGPGNLVFYKQKAEPRD